MPPIQSNSVVNSTTKFIGSTGLMCLALCCLSGCFPRHQEPSSLATNLTVPHVAQDHGWSCGLAVLKSLYLFYNKDLSNADYARLDEQSKNERGLSGAQLLEQLKADQFHAFIFRGELFGDHVRSLSYHLKRGRPVLVLLKNTADLQHYVIIRGMEPNASRIYLTDPAKTQRSLNKSDFLQLWSGTKHFCLLAMPETPND